MMKDGINKNTDLKLIAKTVTGLEEILSQELLRAGGRDIEILHRAVSFTGDLGTVYKANLMVRTALRILIPFAGFRVRNDKELYNVINDYPWEELMDVGDTLAIDTVLNTDNFNHSQYVSQKIKDAIVDRFRSKFGSRPDIDLDNPTIRLNAHINEDVCTIALDSSGESLHKRGYRELTNKAPINEVLAAGLVMLTGWNGRGNFIDPMCGSGTFLIEAALIAANIPPGYYRTGYGFMKWKKYLPFDSELWETIYNAAIDRINSEPVSIAGSDISPNVVKKAKTNIKTARVEDMISISVSDIRDCEVPEGGGIVIINPPYGERMDKDDVAVLYKELGDTFKSRFTGYDCWMITSNMEALKHVGLKTSRKIKVYNGPLECRFVKYSMYKGTRKIHKLVTDNDAE